MEHWDLLDERGNPTGRTISRGELLREGQYHLVEHIWIVDSRGRILIQRRADHLRLMPGTWAANSGSAIAGEDSESAARRELFEELSIRTLPGELYYGGRMRRRNSFTDVWVLYRDIDPDTLRLQREEVAEVRWVAVDELLEMIRQRRFHHYGSAYFQFVFRAIERGCRTLYVTDLDGTLLRDDGTISPSTAQTLNRLISRGMLISAATARGLIGVEMIPLSSIHFRLPVVLMGGAMLYDPGRRRIVQACEMNAETVGRILAALTDAGRTAMLFRRRGNEVHVYYTRLSPAEEAFIRRKTPDGRGFDRFFHHVGQLKASPALFFSCQGSHGEQTALKARLDAIPGIRVELYADTYQSDAWFLEISREDAGKDQGVERLRRRVRAKRVVAFGDNRNDVPLFRTADLAVCVENAAPEARAAADMVIASNEEDGVAAYLYGIYNRKV